MPAALALCWTLLASQVVGSPSTRHVADAGVVAPGSFWPNSDEFVRVEVFIIDWSILFESRASEDKIRRSNHLNAVISDPERFVSVLRPVTAQVARCESPDSCRIDTRTVVDFVRKDGSKRTYIADPVYVVDLERGLRTQTTPGLRKILTFGWLDVVTKH